MRNSWDKIEASNTYNLRKKKKKNPTKSINSDNKKEKAYKSTKKKKVIISDKQLYSNNNYMIKTAKTFRIDLIKKATLAEQTMFSYLKSNNIEFEFQKIIYIEHNNLIEKFYIADFYLPNSRLIVELDGGYHFTITQQVKDSERDIELRKCGYRIFRCANEATFNMDILLNEIGKYCI